MRRFMKSCRCIALAAAAFALAPVAVQAQERPNFVIIVADDLGFSDVGAFGGEIRTPQLDNLARSGVRYTGFYVGPTCSPTRSMLMSGMDNHLAGMGNMYSLVAPNQMGEPGYEGVLSDRVAALPEILQANGYHTYMAGKWHLGKEPAHIPAARGFERDFTLLDGGGSYFSRDGLNRAAGTNQFTEDGQYLDELPGDYYATRTYTDRIIEYIDSNKGDGKPFFAYLAHQAPHDPLQVPNDWLRRYKGWYDCGWDTVRVDRLARMKELGVVDPALPLAPRLWYVPAFADLTGVAQKTVSRKMELYASTVEYMDDQIGRLVAYLRENGLAENTWILFFSDNGPEFSDGATQASQGPASLMSSNWMANTYETDFAAWGRKGAWASYGASWAQVSASPFFGFKGSIYEGGIRSPLIVVAPEGGSLGTVNREAVLHVQDIAPTLLELAGIRQPTQFEGRQVLPMQGRSWVPMLRGTTQRVRGDNDWLAFELFGAAAVREGPWKAVNVPEPYGTDNWQLYNLVDDPTEQIDFAADRPDIVARMVDHWNTYVRDNGVILPDRSSYEMLKRQLPERPAVLSDAWPPGGEPNWGEEDDEDALPTCYVRR